MRTAAAPLTALSPSTLPFDTLRAVSPVERLRVVVSCSAGADSLSNQAVSLSNGADQQTAGGRLAEGPSSGPGTRTIRPRPHGPGRP